MRFVGININRKNNKFSRGLFVLSVKGIRTGIAFNVGIVLLIGMVSINLVTVNTIERDLIRKELEKAMFFISCLSDSFGKNGVATSGILKNPELIKTFSSLTLVSKNGNTIFDFTSKGDAQYKTIFMLKIKASIRTQAVETRFMGQTWGVYWKQPASVMITAPVKSGSMVVGGAGVIIPLESAYNDLRKSQRTSIIYMCINLLVLTALGTYQISTIIKRRKPPSNGNGPI